MLAEDPSLNHASVKAKILASATRGVLLFNQGNSTEVIEATDNLLLRVGTHQLTPKVDDHEEKDDLNIEKPIPLMVIPNAIPFK